MKSPSTLGSSSNLRFATVQAGHCGTSLYHLIGEEAGLRRLVETFYDIIEFEPEGRSLHRLHMRGHGVAHSRIEQFKFLSGFLGGPQLYVQHYGHSDVRKMHEHVEIDIASRDAWLNCMTIAIGRAGLSPEAKRQLMAAFTAVASKLVNRFAVVNLDR